MTLGEFRDMMLRRLLRDDCDTTLADGFIEEAISRIQREVRAPFMEGYHYVDPSDVGLTSLVLPGDYLEGIEVLVGGLPLEKTTFRDLARCQDTRAVAYARYGNQIHIRGAAPPGNRVELLYYASFAGLADDNATNALLTVAPDVLLYATLSCAGDHYQHDSTAAWEGRYVLLRDALKAQAVDDEMGGVQRVSSTYFDPGN